MLIIFEQVLILFIFTIIGYVLSKSGLVKTEHSKILSTILVYVVVPCNIIKTFSSNFTVSYISSNYQILLTSAVIIISVAFVAYFISKLLSKSSYEQRVFEYSLTIANYGFMGYALAESLFGEIGLLNVIIFSIPVSIYTYTYGFCILTKRELTLKRLLNPVTVAMLVGVTLGLTQINMPGVLESVLNKASACLAPVSMLMAGIVISEFDFKAILKNKSAYIVVFYRLIVVPAVLICILKTFSSREILYSALMIYAMPCGMNTIVFPKLVDEDCKTGASLSLISTVLACVTIPVICSFI